jgi:FAD/FMN-containing dehydrogenase
MRAIVGKENLSISSCELYCYSSDASQIRGMPEVVIKPLSTAQVSEIIKIAYAHNIPITAEVQVLVFLVVVFL